jgi:PAS domain S-box-containing protein
VSRQTLSHERRSLTAVPIACPEPVNPPNHGEMEDRIQTLDWSRTPIGPRDNWSPALHTMVRILVANRFPMLLWWGPDYISIYNDAYVPILGQKHPWGLGKPVRECWAEIWEVLRPLIDTPFCGGPATWSEDIELHINRAGFLEETHFTVAYSPVPDETAPRGIGGVLATVNEITSKIIGQRRATILRELAAAVEARTAEEACANAVARLALHSRDIPFALIYLCREDGNFALAASTSIADAAGIAPAQILSDDDSARWPFYEAKATGLMQIVSLTSRVRAIPKGPWPEPPNQAAVLPIRSRLSHEYCGMLVVGISSRLKLDDSYIDFLKLVDSQIATAILTALAYEEERRRAEALAELDRAKTAFFSNVSHEFRTPLTLLLGPLEEILSGNQLAPADRQRAHVAHRNGLRLLKLVNSLLAFSRIEAGGTNASCTPIDLAAVTRDLASSFRSTMEAGGLEFVVNCPPLPEQVYVDLEMWEKIVLNLLSNAFKFTLNGSITVSLEAVDGRAVLSVSDTGIGIPEADLRHIFERFHRVHTAKGRSFEGTGIGLALVQELVRVHGGVATVTSELGKGSTFTVRLPFGHQHLPPDSVRSSATEEPSFGRPEEYVSEALRWLPGTTERISASRDIARHQAKQQDSARSNGHKPHVLIADDNADMRDYITRLLGDSMRVTAVSNGDEALATAVDEPPDLILSDVMMPGLDGLGLLREIRANPATSAIPVILLSARAGEESRIEGVIAGADDYLVKPFIASELLARVTTHLKLAQAREENLGATRRLQEISTRLTGAGGFESLLQEIMSAAVALVNGEFGTLQLLDGDKLRIVAHSGHGQAFLDFFANAEARDSVCGEAMKNSRRVVVEDIEKSPVFAGSPSLAVLRAAGVRAVQSTPLLSRGGKMLGILTTQWSSPHVPDEQDIWRLEVLVRQAADLIEQRIHAELLRISEERLTIATEVAGLGAWEVDLRTRTARWSRRYFEILGYGTRADGEATLEMSRSCVHPEDLDRVDRALLRAQREGEQYASEHRIRRADNGEVRWVAEFGRCIRDSEGEAGRFIGASLDITERVAASRASHLLSAIVDSSDDAIISKNLNGVITSWNKGAEALFGYTAGEAIGQTIAALLVPEDRLDEELSILERLRRGEHIDHFETIRRRRDGTLVDISLSVSPVRDDQGRIVGASKIARDITERREREAQLRKSEEHFRQLAEAGPQIIWLSGPQGDLEFVNRTWVEFSGLDLEATQDPERLRRLLHPDDDVLGWWAKSTATGTPFELEARLRGKNGEFRWFMIRSVPVRDEQGRIHQWVGTSTDIHDSKVLQLELERVNQDLEQFAYTASHDLQEPLRTVRIFTELLAERRGVNFDAQEREFLAHVQDGASRMELLVHDILSYTKAAKVERPAEPADAGAAVQSALANLAGAIAETGAAIDCGQLPFVPVPATQLQQLFQNLVGNALKYHRPGVPPVVSISARKNDGKWVFSVSDNGIGIEPEFREKIFGLFKRLHTRDEYSGTGIGLALCQRIVERYQGRIWVESEPGRGSTFHFTVPV